MKALLVALMCIVPFQYNYELHETLEEQRVIEEEGLEYVYLSCYLPTGYRTADGTVPYEGVVSSNREHLGMDCIVYDENLIPVMRLECRDIGGNKLLREGKAIDVFRDSYDRCLQLKQNYGDHVYIKWIDRSEGKDVSSNSVEFRYEERILGGEGEDDQKTTE